MKNLLEDRMRGPTQQLSILTTRNKSKETFSLISNLVLCKDFYILFMTGVPFPFIANLVIPILFITYVALLMLLKKF